MFSSDKPRMLIVAGVNGAGKSTLYSASPAIFAGTKRINADEILVQNRGDWRNSKDTFIAMREVLATIKAAIASNESFHWETTLSGNYTTLIKMIQSAKSKGYQVDVFYIKVSSAVTAIERVRSRVEKGGHGVSPEIILRRFQKSQDNLERLIMEKAVDSVSIFGNDQELTILQTFRITD